MVNYVSRRRDFMGEMSRILNSLETPHKFPNSAYGKGLNRGTLKDNLDATHRLLRDLQSAQTIILPAEQISVFLEVGKTYTEKLEYRLPYSTVLIQPTKPILFRQISEEPVFLEGVVLSQMDMTKIGAKNLTLFGTINGEEAALNISEVEEDVFLNNAYFLVRRSSGGSLIPMSLTWTSGVFDTISTDHRMESVFKPLATACIGYINCENIYLEKEGEVPEKVNRKREREGKKILEPYYVCRIKGVKYDLNGYAVGEGTHHGFRYDVRGHFRRYETGKTTWVRPHPRGLQNELYIPKTYVVEKGSKEIEMREKTP